MSACKNSIDPQAILCWLNCSSTSLVVTGTSLLVGFIFSFRVALRLWWQRWYVSSKHFCVSISQTLVSCDMWTCRDTSSLVMPHWRGLCHFDSNWFMVVHSGMHVLEFCHRYLIACVFLKHNWIWLIHTTSPLVAMQHTSHPLPDKHVLHVQSGLHTTTHAMQQVFQAAFGVDSWCLTVYCLALFASSSTTAVSGLLHALLLGFIELCITVSVQCSVAAADIGMCWACCSC